MGRPIWSESLHLNAQILARATDPALLGDARAFAHGIRLYIAAGTAVRFELGQSRAVRLTPFGGLRRVFGFNGTVMGDP